MNLKNKKIQKIISSLIIIAVLSPAFSAFIKPPKAEAQFHDVIVGIWTGLTSVFTAATGTSTATTAAISVKNVAKEITKQLVMAVARKALAEMTKSTVNWINTGRFGSPLFVENSQSFFKDIAKSEIKNLINTIGYDSRRLYGNLQKIKTIFLWHG